MLSQKQQKSAEKFAPEMFLAQVLSENYETIENNHIYRVEDNVILENIGKSVDVDFCRNIDEFKDKLEHGKPNLLIDANLINKTLLREILKSSSQIKNIILGDF